MRFRRTTAICLAAALLVSGGGFSAFAGDYLTDPLRLAVRSPAEPPEGLPVKYTSPYTDTRGQGEDSVGWAFAAVAAIEAAGRAKGKLKTGETFSENHMRYALSADGGNTLGFDRRYTEAGSRRMVTAYLMRGRLSGPVPTSSDPYSAGAGRLPRALSETSAREREARVTGVIYLPDAASGNEALALGRMKSHVREYGAVAVSFYYDEDAYVSGFYRHAGDEEADHAAAVIGWDDTYAYTYTGSDGARERGTGAFFVKDSEGASGRSYWISYDTPLTDAYAVRGLSGELFDVTHEHDPLGPSATIGFRSNTAWIANVFTVGEKTEALTALSFFAAGEDTSVEFYLTQDAEAGPDALREAAQGSPVRLEGGGTSAFFSMPGYYTVKLDRPAAAGAKGGTFAVLAKVTTAYSAEPAPLQAAGSAPASGRSFISGDGAHWIDAAGNNAAYVCLKAHCAQDVEIPLSGASLKAPAAREGALEGGVLHLSTGAALKLEAASVPMGATNIQSVTWQIKNPGGAYESPDISAPPSDTDVIRLDPATGRLTAVRAGTAYVRVSMRSGPVSGLLAAPGGLFEDTLEVRVGDVAAVTLTLSQTEAELTTAQTLRLNAAVQPEDTTDKAVLWSVAADRWGTAFPLGADADDPYNESRPPAEVDADGTVRPLRPGECWMFARTKDGGAEAYCRVTITEIPATGLSLPGKRTISTGTEYTLRAQYAPADASYRDTLWSSSDESVASVTVDGIVTGRSAGTVRIFAADRYGHTALCEVTVTDAPTAVVGLDKNVTLTVQGFSGTGTDVLWEQSSGAVLSAAVSAAPGGFSTEQHGTFRLRVTARSAGSTLITAVIRRNRGTQDEPDYAVVGRQSWRLEGVVPLRQLRLTGTDRNTVKKLTLCMDASGRLPPESATLVAAVLNPEGATELGYVWSSRNEAIAKVEQLPGSRKGSAATITASEPGTTRITAVNYNSGRRATVTVTVKPYPSGVKLLSKPDITLKAGKRAGVRAKATGASGADTALLYRVQDAPGNPRPHTDADPIATVDEKGRVTAVRVGAVTVTALAKPYGEAAPGVSVHVRCILPVKDVALSAGSYELLTNGGTNLNVALSPPEASDTGLSFVVSDSSVALVKACSFGYVVEGLKPGIVKITVVTGDGKRASVRITVQ